MDAKGKFSEEKNLMAKKNIRTSHKKEQRKKGKKEENKRKMRKRKIH